MNAPATLTDAPIATVRRFVDAFNRLDANEVAACFAQPSFILDGLAPHVWAGTSAPADWFRDALAESEHLGVSDFRIALGDPLHDQVTGDAAYFAAPATMTFKARGQMRTQPGAILTLALVRSEGRWLIRAWTWTKGSGGGIADVPA